MPHLKGTVSASRYGSLTDKRTTFPPTWLWRKPVFQNLKGSTLVAYKIGNSEQFYCTGKALCEERSFLISCNPTPLPQWNQLEKPKWDGVIHSVLRWAQETGENPQIGRPKDNFFAKPGIWLWLRIRGLMVCHIPHVQLGRALGKMGHFHFWQQCNI